MTDWKLKRTTGMWGGQFVASPVPGPGECDVEQQIHPCFGSPIGEAPFVELEGGFNAHDLRQLADVLDEVQRVGPDLPGAVQH